MLSRLLIVLLAFTLSGPVAARDEAQTAYDFVFTAIEGGPLPLSSFEGQVVLVVNTASFCGFTHQYAGLQRLWERYFDRLIRMARRNLADGALREADEEDVVLSAIDSFSRAAANGRFPALNDREDLCCW